MEEWKPQRQIREERVARIRFWSAFVIITLVLLIQSTIHSCSPTAPSTREYDAAAAQREAARRAE